MPKIDVTVNAVVVEMTQWQQGTKKMWIITSSHLRQSALLKWIKDYLITPPAWNALGQEMNDVQKYSQWNQVVKFTSWKIVGELVTT